MKADIQMLEAVLFAAAKPISIENLRDILEIDEHDVVSLVAELEENLLVQRRGISIFHSAMGVELVTCKEAVFFVEKIREKEDKLSTAMMETLSVIAFKQPITKAKIEEIRGVNSERLLKQLLEKSLIEEVGKLQLPGRPILYGTTQLFLRSLGIKSLNELTTEFSDDIRVNTKKVYEIESESLFVEDKEMSRE